MAKYKSVDGAFSTIDTFAELTTLLGESGKGPIKVPNGSRRIVEIHHAAYPELAAAEEVTIVLRLSGDGIMNSPQTMILGSYAAQGGTATGDTEGKDAKVVSVDMVVNPNENITVEVGASGTALSLTGSAGITLVFA